MREQPDPAVDRAFTPRAPTDVQLATILPTLTVEQRIEAVIRKYVGGATSAHYDGETPSPMADARIAAYLMRKLRPWIRQPAKGAAE